MISKQNFLFVIFPAKEKNIWASTNHSHSNKKKAVQMDKTNNRIIYLITVVNWERLRIAWPDHPSYSLQ